ncbi:MAG: glycoside hydrolase family 27 protein, partial [Asticcacaulis sp.]|nr:glycoside hydrolase family 27 protein [Asticcacaulis sp.]
MNWKTCFAILGAMAIAGAGHAFAHDTLGLDAPKPQIAMTPPMGWNSWN